mgnify:CR=1 FL=1
MGANCFRIIQMKTLLTIFVLFFSSSILSQEYKSNFGFTALIPENYIMFTEDNLDEVTKTLDDLNFDMSVWNSLRHEFGNEEGEYLYNIDDLNNEFRNNINFGYSEGTYEKITKDTLSLCSYYNNMLSDFAKTDVTQLKCDISSIPGIKGNSLYLEHYGVLPGIANIQYMFWINNYKLIDATLTCVYDDCIEDRIIFKNIITSIKND